MSTLYQLHSTMDNLRASTEQLAVTWNSGDSLLLLGTTVAYIDWLQAYLTDNDIEQVAGIFALTDDIAQLNETAMAALNLKDKLIAILTDNEWVTMTLDKQFDKVVTIAL